MIEEDTQVDFFVGVSVIDSLLGAKASELKPTGYPEFATTAIFVRNFARSSRAWLVGLR